MACTKETVKPSGLNIWSSEAADGSAPEVDIIAVQGLGAPPFYTWVKKVPKEESKKRSWAQMRKDGNPLGRRNDGEDGLIEVMWPRDLLVPLFPNARIATYSYKSDWRDPEVKTNLRECAEQFLNILQQHRQHPDEQKRPLVLIGHSLGSLVIQEALVVAVHHKDFHNLRLSVAGVIFLGAPFQGSDIARVGARLAQLSGLDSTILKLLEKDSPSLYALSRDFWGSHSDWDLVCFYEKREANYGPIKKQVVSPQSASLPGKRRIFLNTDHSGLNKFSGVDDENFALVLPEIRRMVEKGRSNIAELDMSRERGLLEQADSWIRIECYTADRLKIVRLSDDELPMDQCYINLAIVEHSGRDATRSEGLKIEDTPSYSSPFSLSARLKIETPNKNIQIKLQTLFNPRKGPDGVMKRPKRILIRGRAGVGKTTLCKKIVFDFTYYDVWKELFDRLLWVPLRRLKGKTAERYDFEDLFFDMYFRGQGKDDGWRLAKELWQTLKDTSGAKTLFILDGLDEVSELLDPDHKMFSILQDLLNQPNVIITSRPLGKRLGYLDLELETIGFYPDQVKDYLEKTLCDSKKVDEIQSFLQKNWLIQGLVRIPIQLDALCYVWDDEFSSGAMTQTMTALYQAIEQRLWKKDAVKLEKCRQGRKVTNVTVRGYSPQELEGLVYYELDLLEWLSFIGLHGDVINFDSKQHLGIISSHFKLETCFSFAETLVLLSFLRTPNPSSDDSNQNYHFLHLTFQEYFAARYFVRKWTSEGQLRCLELRSSNIKHTKPVSTDPVSYLRKHKYNERYDIFWRFVAGLLGAEGGGETCRFFQTIEDEPRDLLGPVHQRLVMHCLSEIAPSWETPQFSQLREHLEGQLKQWLLFECNFEFDKEGRSQLAAEMEFPEQILKDILQKESEDVKLKILNSLTTRPRIPPAIMKLVASCLGGDVSISLKKGALAMFHRLHEGLPDEIIQAVAALLKDPEGDVRSAAAGALRRQSALSDEIVQAVAALLKDPEKDVRSAVAEVLREQSALPDEIVQAVAALLKDPVQGVRSAAVWALGQRSALPDEIIQAIAALLKDLVLEVRLTAAEALHGQLALPDEIVQAVAALLKDPFGNVRSAAASTLGQQSALPDEIIQTVAALLKDPEGDVRLAAAEVLGEQSALSDERFYYFLLKLDSQSFNNLYGVWLRRSLSDHLTWYVKGKNYSINMPEGGRNIPFDQLESRVQEAQAFLKVPLLKEL